MVMINEMKNGEYFGRLVCLCKVFFNDYLLMIVDVTEVYGTTFVGTTDECNIVFHEIWKSKQYFK